LVRAPV